MNTRTIALVVCLGVAVAAGGQEISVTVDTGGADWVPRTGTLNLVFDRTLGAEQGHLAVILGSVDITDLFERKGEIWRYRSEVFPLPSGERQLAVFHIGSDGSWSELATHDIRVLRRGGLESLRLAPRADLSFESRFDEDHRPADSGPDPATYDKGTLRLGFEGEVKRSGWAFDPRIEILGVSEREEALRFSELGEDADTFDLASYSLSLRRPLRHGDLALEIGHISWTSNPYLASFQHRGLTLRAPVTRGMSASAIAASGSSLVGWQDPLGLDRARHRIYGFGADFDLISSRPGGLLLSFGAIDGSILPIQDFGRGEVTDAEESRGFGLELRGASPTQRLRFDAAWATSRFRNPTDPLLSQGSELVAVEEETRQAWNGGLELDLLRGRPLGAERSIDLTLALRHEEIEPQFRTVGAFVAADRRQSTAELRGLVGPASIQLAHSRTRDNLDGLASILTTRTERGGFHLAVPLGEVFGGNLAWPALNVSLDRTHQYGLTLPENGGFSPSHVPDQVSWNRTLGLDWAGAHWRFGYRWTVSEQDNRQPGRQRADFDSLVQGISFGLTPHPRLDLGFDLDREVAESVEFETEDTVTRYGINFSLRLPRGIGFTGQWSESDSEDEPRVSMSTAELLDLAWTWDWNRVGKTGAHGVGGQLFLRYSEQTFDSRDLLFSFFEIRSSRSATAGINLNLH
ncbi:MAG: hypothetical protein MPN21_16850 [Thermoanaerobaculia bacterium]|nr:hypothetical protein [Thermoanaerobaculia bacterium]